MRWASERDAMALPNLGTLSLRPAAAPPTGEFYSLKEEEADERNAGGGDGVPITLEEYVPSKERTDGGDYFRVRYTYRNPLSFDDPNAPKYLDYMFDAQSLWEYTRRTGRNALTRKPLWREDWRELHDRYGHGAPEPWFVATLPSLEESVEVYAGGRQEGRLVRVEWPDYGLEHYEGDALEERLVRAEWPDGEVWHYKGNKGEEHKVREEFSEGEVQHYVGNKGEEHKVRAEWPNGHVQHFKGNQGEEHRVRSEFPSGQVQHYEGDAGEERLVRTVLPDGEVP